MDIVCEVCGVVGFRDLLKQCSNCKNAARHQYCMDPVIYNGSSFKWFCDDCPPKHSEVSTENMNDVVKMRSVTSFYVTDDSGCDDHYSIQLGSIIDEPNVNSVDVTKEPLSWGRRRHRSHKAMCTWACRRRRSQKARRESFDASTKHFLSADTFHSSEMFDMKKLKQNDILEEGESKNDPLNYQPESADGSSNSASDRITVEIQKTGGAVGPTMNTMECLDLSLEIKEQGAEAGLCASVEDVEEQVDGSSPASESSEQPVPLKVVILRPWNDVPNSILRSKPPSNYSQSMQGSDLYVANVDVWDSSKEWLDSRLKLDEQGVEPGLFVKVEYVEQTHPNFTDKTSPIWSSEEQVDGSSPTSESWEQPEPLEVVRPCDDVPNSILKSKPPSNYSQPMQGSDLDVGNMDVLDPSKDQMNSRLMLNTVEPSSSSNGGGRPVEEDDTEKTECLSGMHTVTPELDSVKGSNPSAEPSSSLNGGASAVEKHSAEMAECLLGLGTLTPALHNVSSLNGEGASAVEKHIAEMAECLLGLGTLTPALHNVQALNPSTPKECLVDNSDEPNRSDKVHRSRNDFNGSYYPKPVLKGRIPKMVYPRLWFPLSKMWLVGKHHKWKIPLPSKHVSPHKGTKNSFRKQCKGPNRHIPRHTKHQNTKLVIKDRNADPPHTRSCRLSKQIDRTCSSASLDLSPKTKEVNDVNDAEPRCSKSVRTFENVMAKKRKRPILSHDEDAEAMQMEVRMRRQHVKSRVAKQLRSAENSEEVMSPGISNNQRANDDTKARKQRRANKDKKAPLGNASVQCTQNDAARLASDQQSFICTGPIDKPYWTGIMKIGREHISLAAHLSNQACKEVQELSLSLPALMKVSKHSKLKAWPGRWKASEPTAECIGLYFFSDNMRELDQLVHYLTDHSLVLKYVVGYAKLLIFPSVFLPEQCQRFQGKHYLWGVFKRRMGTGKTGAAG